MPDLICNNNCTTKCTICGVFVDELYEHPILKVSICKTCFNDVKSSDSKIDGCLWCGHDKEMLFCVQCPRKCCVDCITRNVGSEYMRIVNEKNWSCFVCDSDPIKEQQFEHLKNKSSDPRMLIVPDGSVTTIDISSPVIVVDESDECTNKEVPSTNPHSQDLDFILGVYEKQIKSSLEYEDANIPAIIKEINSIKTDQLNVAIYSFKKCLTAFMSDLTNLETRVTQATAFNNPATSIKLTALLRILVQHHIFNRICHPQSRIKDDRVSWVNEKSKPCNYVQMPIPVVSTSKPAVLIVDPTKRKSMIIKQQVHDRKDKEVNDMVTKIKDLCSKRRNLDTDDEDFEPSSCAKRQKMGESAERISRQVRSLVTPSWLSDFKIEKEDDMIEDMIVDRDWTDPRLKRMSGGSSRRGRPPKYLSFSERSMDHMMENYGRDDSGQIKSRGRPKKTVFINVKEPRYYVQKKNGENLASSL